MTPAIPPRPRPASRSSDSGVAATHKAPLVAAVLLAALTLPHTATGDETGPESEPAQRFGFGQSMRVDRGERVDTIVTIGGDLTVLGDVEEDAVVIGGDLELGPAATVGGDAIAIGGAVLGADTAFVGGERIEVDGALRREVTREAWIAPPLATSLATLAQVLASFLISALLLAFVPRRVRGVAEQIRVHPGRATLFGLALLVLFVPLLGALTISVVGIPLIPVAVMLLAAVLVFGLTALGLRIGYALPFYSEERSAMGALALGYTVLAILAIIPWAGALLIPLLALFAGGAVLTTWFGRTAPYPA